MCSFSTIQKILFGCLFVSIVLSCEKTNWWTPPEQSQECNPATKKQITQVPMWRQTFGSSVKRANACLRIAWGTNDDEGKSILVQLGTDGTIHPLETKKNPQATTLSLEVPETARNKPRSFRLFVFGSGYQTRRGERNLCLNTMSKPRYQCLTREEEECWFAIAFKPKSTDTTILSANIPEAPSRSCHIQLREPALSEEPQGDGGTEIVPEQLDRREASSEPVQDRQESRSEPQQPDNLPETKQEAQPDKLPPQTPCGTPPCVSTLAGTGLPGRNDGAGAKATFLDPKGIISDSQGNLYVADSSNHVIRKITPTGIVTTFAGNGIGGTKNGSLLQAQFNFPAALTIDKAGNFYIADTENHVIRKIDTTGQVTLYAGKFGTSGSANGTRLSATFDSPEGITIDAAGNLYVSDTGNHVIRKITRTTVSTFAGAGTFGYKDGRGLLAFFDTPKGITIDKQGNLYVADFSNHRIRKITSSGVVSTLIGNGTNGLKDGPALQASLHKPSSLSLTPTGDLYIIDTFNYRIRFYQKATDQLSTAAGSFQVGSRDGPAKKAQFDLPQGIAVGTNGRVYIADTDNNKIRVFYPR